VSITQNTTLKAKAVKSGMPDSSITAATYLLQVATPSISPAGGTYTSARSVTMSVTTSGATIRYTTDGSAPTESSTAYTGAVTVGTTTTVKAAGFKTNWTTSATASVTYTMNFGTLAAPTIDPGAGTFDGSVSVTLASIAGATLRYTMDGTTPSGSSPLYTAPVVLSASATLQARAFHPDYTQSPVASAAYVVRAAAPTFSPTAGAYAPGQAITITSATPGATIHYTLNGADPTTADAVVASGSTIVAGDFTLKAKALKTGNADSLTSTATYTVSGAFTGRQIRTGGSHTAALRQDGSVWTWGHNGSGQLGDGTSTARVLPNPVAGATGALAVAAGDTHTLALLGSGTVVGWGQNGQGQLGDGTTTNRLLPTPVSGLSSIVMIASRYRHALAVTSSGTVWAWGRNPSGQIGDGTTTDRTTPVALSGLTNITAAAAGWEHSLALRSDGVVFAWGANASGQLGTGTTAASSTPVQVPGLSNITAIAAGLSYSVALSSDGTVWVWGENGLGQLGDGTFGDQLSPVAVTSLTDVTAVAAGSSHTLVVASSGTVFATGANSAGQLGTGDTTTRGAFEALAGLPAIVHVAAGTSHSLAMTADGIVYSWGANAQGQLGDGTSVSTAQPVEISGPGMAWKSATPTFSLASGTYLVDQSVVVATADPSATLHYTTDGSEPTTSSATLASGASVAITATTTLRVRGWRPNAPPSVIATAAYVLKAVAPVVTPASGAYTAPLAVTASTSTAGASLRYTLDGAEPTDASPLYSGSVALSQTATVRLRAFKTGWSPSDSGQASYWISAGVVPTPTMLPAGGTITTAPFVQLACTLEGAIIRFTQDGSDPTEASPAYIYPFAIGVTTTVKARAYRAGYTPSAVASVTYTLPVSGVAAPSIAPGGGRYTTAVTVQIAGDAGATLTYTTDGTDPTDSSTAVPGSGQLTIDRSLVLKVRAFATGQDPSPVRRADFVVTGALAAGTNHTVALKVDGTVWTWGQNASGQVGDGTTTNRTSPVQVLTGAIAIAAGAQHTVAVKADGTVWAWGLNSGGQLGLGTTSSQWVPAQVPGLTNVVAVAAGDTHTMALKNDGTVWAWGNNADGEVGDGTTTRRTLPVAVSGLQGVSHVAAGDHFSIAVQRDGARTGFVWSWGRNTVGQLGDHTTVARAVPGLVSGLTSVERVAVGRDSAMAVLTDGSVVTWGGNGYTQLGVGSTTNAVAPMPVPFLRGVVLVARGTYHALVLGADGRAFGWGADDSEQLGRVTYATSPASSVPQALVNFGTPLALVAGHAHSVFVAPGGAVMGVGANVTGQLGQPGVTGYTADPVDASGLVLADNVWLTTDTDGDGLTAWREYLLGTDPLTADSNGNGIPDGAEAAAAANAANTDTDGDGVSNWAESANGTDPYRADTDGDGYSDAIDLFALDPTRHALPAGTPGDTTPPVITLIEPTSATPLP
jgi:alpha-tubulin suppressor-like RCC1 family protein